jgi:hypothetical protein
MREKIPITEIKRSRRRTRTKKEVRRQARCISPVPSKWNQGITMTTFF